MTAPSRTGDVRVTLPLKTSSVLNGSQGFTPADDPAIRQPGFDLPTTDGGEALGNREAAAGGRGVPFVKRLLNREGVGLRTTMNRRFIYLLWFWFWFWFCRQNDSICFR